MKKTRFFANKWKNGNVHCFVWKYEIGAQFVFSYVLKCTVDLKSNNLPPNETNLHLNAWAVLFSFVVCANSWSHSHISLVYSAVRAGDPVMSLCVCLCVYFSHLTLKILVQTLCKCAVCGCFARIRQIDATNYELNN